LVLFSKKKLKIKDLLLNKDAKTFAMFGGHAGDPVGGHHLRVV
jgi:hypothetical protein